VGPAHQTQARRPIRQFVSLVPQSYLGNSVFEAGKSQVAPLALRSRKFQKSSPAGQLETSRTVVFKPTTDENVRQHRAGLSALHKGRHAGTVNVAHGFEIEQTRGVRSSRSSRNRGFRNSGEVERSMSPKCRRSLSCPVTRRICTVRSPQEPATDPVWEEFYEPELITTIRAAEF